MRGLSLEEANTIIEATFAAAKKRKCRPMSAIVLDAGGRVKAFQKQDGASMLRFEICYGKAYGALAPGRPSKLVLQKARKSRYSCSPWRVSPIIRCFLKAVVNSSATGRASCWARSGSLATPMNPTICARLPAFTPRNSAPTAIFSTIRI
jgi:Haem-degrading